MIYNKWKSFAHFLKNKGNIPSGIELDMAPRGAGKSTVGAKKMYQFCTRKKNPYEYFYSNIEFKGVENPRVKYLDLINFKLTDYLDPDDELWNYYHCSTNIDKDGKRKKVPFYIQHNSIIFLDEVGILYHSRQFKSFPPEFITWTKLLRKAHQMVYMNSQTYDTDKSIRDNCNQLRISKRIGWWSLSRLIVKRPGVITRGADSDGNGGESTIGDIVRVSNILDPDWMRITFIPFYTDLFNSFK